MRTKQEYQEALVEIENMLFDDESITLQLYRQCKNRLEILQELVDHITPMKVIQIEDRPACPHCKGFDIYDEQADHWNEISEYYQKGFCGDCGGALIIDQEELIDNYKEKEDVE